MKAHRAADVLVEAQPLVDQTSTLHTLFLTELAVTAGALVLALAGGWWLVRLGLRPLEDVEATADSIAAGNLDQRVPGADQPTEVGRLARALNVMLERIQAAFSARVASEARLKRERAAPAPVRGRRVARAAHADRRRVGLRRALRAGRRTSTPRTCPRVVVGHPHRDGAHGPAGQRPPHPGPARRGRARWRRRPVELVALVSEAVRTATAVGPEWPVQFWAASPVEVIGDKDRLRQVIDNLLANVRAHTPPGHDRPRCASTRSATRPRSRCATPARACPPRRRGASSSASTGPTRRGRGPAAGAGSGSPSSRPSSTAHGGHRSSAASAPGEGMTVTVRLPVERGRAAEPDRRPGVPWPTPPQPAA